MGDIHLHFSNNEEWNIIDNVYIRGNAYYVDYPIDQQGWTKIISGIKTFDEFISLLRQLNGFFALIFQIPEGLFVATDRIRSIPIFYNTDSDDIYISDDPEWIKNQVADAKIDEISAAEFSLTGYVTGNNTLLLNIKQLQAGEVLSVTKNSKGLNIETRRYSRYSLGNFLEKPREELIAEFDGVLTKIFRRLILWANGRTIVVPLSGGFDSRLIVLMLRRLDYKNIIAFSYGKPGNKESEISKEISANLNIKWEFVPYSNKLWHEWFNSPEWKAYCHKAYGLSTLPHIQDWPAVWWLKREQKIPDESIFVPGHTVIPAYYEYPNVIINNNVIKEKDLIKSILHDHYNLWEWSKEKDILEPILEKRIKNIIGTSSIYTTESAASAYECWEHEERQAKFITNSVRVYEFWGYDWWLPFWDAELFDFWRRVPLSEQIGQKLFRYYTNDLFLKIFKKEIKTIYENKSNYNILNQLAIKACSKTNLLDGVLEFYLYQKRSSAYENHPLSFWGIISKDNFKKYYSGIESINSFLVLEILGSIFINLDKTREVVSILNNNKMKGYSHEIICKKNINGGLISD